jgi:Flp pilus assembly protein TadG
MKALRHRRNDVADTGATAVEFALVLPLLLLLVFGIIDMGAVFTQQLGLNNAVRQGARAAVVYGTSTTGSTDQQCATIVSNVRASTNSIIALNPAVVDVTTTRVLTSDGKTQSGTTNQCGGVPNSTSTNRPCAGSFNPDVQGNDSLQVVATYQAKLLIPFPPFPQTLNLTATAVYRCEWT